MLSKAADAEVDGPIGAVKRDLIGALRGTVVELGPGPGSNMRYYAPGVHVIAIEPNPTMHAPLRDAADEHGVDLEIRSLRGEAIDVPDGAADAVVATLVLCGVDDPQAVVGEVRRILHPGGTYVIYEHVAARPGTLLARIQRAVRRPHRWMANGCEVDRDTRLLLEGAGFAELHLEDLELPVAEAAWTRTRILGHAVR